MNALPKGNHLYIPFRKNPITYLAELLRKLKGYFSKDQIETLTEKTADPTISNGEKSVYNLDRLLSLAEGDDSFTIQMLHLFLQNIEEDLYELKEECNNGQWDRVAGKAHKIAPAFHYLGLDRLVALLNEIEGKAQHTPDPMALNQLVEQAYNQYNQVKPLIVADLRKLQSTVLPETSPHDDQAL